MSIRTARSTSTTAPRSARRALVAALAATAAVLLAGCAGPSTEETTAPVEERTLTVFAAASLTATYEELADIFEEANPGVTVSLNFGGSSGLVTQIQEGAPADVFASADEANMTKLVDAELAAGTPEVFATNRLQIAVPTGNPAGIETFADLAHEGLRLVICAPEVPCGAATAAVAEIAGVTLAPVSEESAVTDVLGKVRSGEADAGLVYVTDVIGAAGEVEGIAFPESDEVVNVYPIVVVEGAAQPELAEAFLALVLSEEGQAILAAAGFGAPAA